MTAGRASPQARLGADVRADLRRAVLFEFFVAEAETYVFVARADWDSPRVVRVPLGRARLREVVERHFPPGLSALDEEAVNEELRRLVVPFETFSEPGDLIWTVPHDVLHHVPFHALRVNGGPLLARNPVCSSPSASVLRHCRARSHADRSGAAVLVDSRNDLPLAHADAQEFAVRDHIVSGSVTVLKQEQVTRQAVRRVLELPVDVVHIACHGVFSGHRGQDAGILLAPDGSADGERFTAADLLTVGIRARLVVLSACDSGLSRRVAGDELLGLTRAVIHAGARSLLVTLWQVEALPAGFLMRRFYHCFGSSSGPADALREAALATRDATVADVLEYCAEVHARVSPSRRPLLERDIADLRYLAGDHRAAADAYEDLLRDHPDPGPDAAAGTPNPVSALRRDDLVAAASRSRRAARVGVRPDYTLQPFSSPFHWAAFTLVGDWT
ncbi:CHAT domain-containing protein [Streptomyces sp. TLI_55]|nr:CHAT domain-containing protein [Streptomyces sp. TLI_55]